MVEDARKAHLPRPRPHHLLDGPDDGSAHGLAPGPQAPRQGRPREARSAVQPAPELGSLLDASHALSHPLAGQLPLHHGRRRPPHPHGRHHRSPEGRSAYARQPHGERRRIDRMGSRPARGRRGLLLHPAPLPRLRLHNRFPGGPAPGRDDRHVPQVRHGNGPGGAASPTVHLLPGCSAHVRAPPGCSRGHKRGPVIHPFLSVGRDATVGLAGRPVGAGDRWPHDRRLRHDGGLPDHPGITARFLASTRGAGHPLPLHPGEDRGSRKSEPRGHRGRGR